MDADSRISRAYAFECTEYFHFAELSPFTALLYGLAFKITKGAKEDELFFASAKSIADYYSCSESKVRRGLKQLDKSGFLQLIRANTFQTNVYRVLTHKEWMEAHPGKCCSKLKYHYSEVGDPLGNKLWRVTGGRVRFQQWQIDNFRKFNLSDDEVAAIFSDWWNQVGLNLRVQDVSRCFYKKLESAA